MNDELVIFIGDDTGGTFGRKLEFTISVEEGTSLDGCSAEFVFDGIVRQFPAPLVDGETREIVYTADETAQMAKGVRYASFRVIDANGKVRTFTNTIRVRCTDIVAEVYPGTSGISITIGGGSVAWNDIAGKPNFAPVATSGSYNDLTDKPSIPSPVTVDSALSATSENPVQNKVIAAALETGYTAFVCVPATYDGKTLHVENEYGEWRLYADDQFLDPPVVDAPDDATNLTFSVYGVTATRTRITPKKTSQLTNDGADGASQFATVAQLPTWGSLKPTGGIPATDLASGVQTSLGKADTALQSSDIIAPSAATESGKTADALAVKNALAQKADASSLPYALVEKQLSLSAFSFSTATADGHHYEAVYEDGRWELYYVEDGYTYDTDPMSGMAGENTIEGPDALTIQFDDASDTVATRGWTAALTDRAINAISLTSAATLIMPAVSVAGHARDLVVRLSVGAADLNITWGTADAGGVAVDYETEGGKFPDLSEAGTYLVRLTETAAYAAGTGGAADVPAKFLIQCQALQTAVAGGAA